MRPSECRACSEEHRWQAVLDRDAQSVPEACAKRCDRTFALLLCVERWQALLLSTSHLAMH
eukprot:10274152-Prorocentrum_lima.AAC.1